jgi:RNA polymerase subunit RPABC4/transcription elongation factor Spt4
MPIDPTSLGNLALILSAWGGAFIAALWLSMIFWTYRDIRNRSRDHLARVLAVLVVTVLFLPGIVVYLIMRPPRTLEEEYQQSLEEEALLQAIEDISLCPGCGRRVKETWMVCPNCHTRLKKRCHQCSKLMDLPWNLCPYCGTPAPGVRREHITLNEAVSSILVEEVEEEEPEAETLEEADVEPVEEPLTEAAAETHSET